jgi:L-threonylcarbamoyladenylate synthase
MLCDIAETLKNIEVGRVAVLSYNRRFDKVAPTHQVVLTDSNSLTQAASRLFSAMRYLDSLDVDLILAELVPNEGLGLAINDRLTRAAAK